jgi:hypothetical protein
MFAKLDGCTGNVVGVKFSEKITHADYQQMIPLVDEAIKQHGKIRVLFELSHITGVELQAVWDDTKFEMGHATAFEKCAVVGDRKWEQFAANLCKPFLSAQIKYFDVADFDKAIKWVHEA